MVLPTCATPVWLTAALSGLAGYADVITFQRYGVMAASQSGTLIFAGRSLMSEPKVLPMVEHETVFYVFILISWTAGAGFYYLARHFYPSLAATLACSVATVLALVADTMFNVSSIMHHYDQKWWLCGLVPVFGVQNAVTTDVYMKTCTVAASSNMQQLADGFVKLAVGELDSTTQQKSFEAAVMLVSFLLGGALGEAVRNIDGRMVYWCYMPVAPLVLALLVTHDLTLGPRTVRTAIGESAAPSLEAEEHSEDGQDSDETSVKLC